ncbi:MAG: site-specific DNA-methyltransferase, partial [Gemmatales bacterium]|nr:site-specific DNA-methyltransferase [Gemmatales bacterium]MDW8174396.1 site-specific DNA-methyltransferase [Gemmatales bacterium]
AQDVLKRGKKRQDVWVYKDPPFPRYPTEKNLDLLKTIILASSHAGDLVLDGFAGSGTALVAAELLGRRWIGIDSSWPAVQVAQRRLHELPPSTPFALVQLPQPSNNLGPHQKGT